MTDAQQLARIALYHIGAVLFGDAVASGEAYQAAIGGVISVAAFGWWLWQQRRAR